MPSVRTCCECGHVEAHDAVNAGNCPQCAHTYCPGCVQGLAEGQENSVGEGSEAQNQLDMKNEVYYHRKRF